MFSKCCEWNFAGFIVIFLYLQGAAGFFVKHIETGMCINDTSIIQSGGTWGNLSHVELSNNCLDPAAQFRFRDNGAMFNLKRQGCLAAYSRGGSGYRHDMFYLYVSDDLDRSACAQKTGAYRAITQTSWGGLSVYYRGHGKSVIQTWCAVPKTDDRLKTYYGINPSYIGLTTPCNDTEDKRFNFGSVTCYGNMVENANCPKASSSPGHVDQYMVVKTASYRGLPDTKTCGLSDDYSCAVDVTCFVKKQCDSQHECNITMNDTLFSGDPCPGLTKYLYFEYQCVNSAQHYTNVCVLDVFLSNSSLPNEGVVQIITDSGTKKVCGQSLKNKAKDVVCHQLGYKRADSLVNMPVPSDAKDEIFSGSINCDNDDKDLFQCSITTSTRSCSQLSYIKCHICDSPLLGDKQRIPDSSFTASASSEGHSASDARISSGSSWCAPVSDHKHYLEVDLGRLYVLFAVATFGDAKAVTSFNVNYTVDLMNWKQAQTGNENIFQGNKNAYNDAAITSLNATTTRALRFIPLSYVVQPCTRIEICGATLFPDKPRDLTVTNITSRSAGLSWLDPEIQGYGDSGVSRFWIKLKKDNSLILNTTTGNVNEYEINYLTPYTRYEISVAAGNQHGFGEETITSFLTSEGAPSGPPLNIKTTSRSASTLFFTWEPPEKSKRNGVIISYTACVLESENGPCFLTFTTTGKDWIVRDLNPSTKYYVRVRASTKVDHGNYSESKGFFTNGKAAKKATAVTSNTLTFSLEIPSKTFLHFYVVVLKLKDGKEPKSSGTYKNNELVTYAEARKSPDPKPYLAAVITSSGVDGNMFILGDGRNTSNPTSRRRRSTTSNYYNGPLDPGTSYSIFQRIFINDKGEYYSTDWSPASKTSEYTGSPRVLANMSSGDIKAEEGDLVNLLCSAQGEPPISFSWEKDQKPLESFIEKDNPHRSSFLVVTVKDQSSFGKYICHIRDRFASTTHIIRILKETCTVSGTDENDDGSEKYLVGIIVLAIVVVILLLILAYSTYQIHLLKSAVAKAYLENTQNRTKQFYDDVNHYEQVENEQSKYSALKKPEEKENDDHLYSHLNEVQKECANQEETAM